MGQPRGWVRVPVGEDAEDAARWTSRGRCRRVLLVVHNVTAATRLLDVLPLFRDDLRVQLLAACTGSSPFQSGVPELLDAVGVPVLPWEQAVRTPVDLAVSASFGGELTSLKGPLTVLSHGVGYNKKLAATGDRRPATGDRRPATGDRRPATGVFGLSPEWLLERGEPVADALVFSHHEQIERLRGSCPEALPAAVLGGDPCYDRILAAERHRDRYRRALGVHDGRRLVLLNSTWNPASLFGDGGPEDVLPLLLPRLASELPVDEYRVAAVLHPNITAGHGHGQLRLWLDRARRAGLTLVDPLDGWRQALIAADAVIGDFGSVSFYAAARGTPVLLGAASLDGLGADSPVADFVRTAPRLDPHAPLRPQLDALLAGHRPLPGPAAATTSDPGRSADLLRGLFYRLIGIPEPPGPALLDPLPLPPYDPAPVTAPLYAVTTVEAGGGPVVRVARYAGREAGPEVPGSGHLAVHEDTLDPGALDLADVVWRHGDPSDPRLGPPEAWAAEVLARYPGCSLAAYATGPHTCTVVHRRGRRAELTGGPGTDASLYASAFFALLDAGVPVDGSFTVVTGAVVHRVESRPAGPALAPDHVEVGQVRDGVLGGEQHGGLLDQR